MSMYYSKFTGNAQRRIRLKRAVRRTIIIGASRSEPHTTEFYAFLGILGECRALWGERSEAWYRVTAAADADIA